ncbi:SDR family oxidoreductase [Collimonas sp.]|jgi:NAD(P)H dehydrogenase (quinone)|uniref:SDR family oxidoreductase n=1 Tax=Collimonas sp. TaxID=1963772 RepID=UPI002BF09D2D|nr:SDR family oxidoreductase [Collimonas sp.]HWW07304.1 SDR family oxidoreductase [Collimonas sp.]
MIVVTGATGQLGRLVIQNLLRTEPASSIVAVVRDPAKAADLSILGVQVRQADYTQPASLKTALAGADKLLLISSSELGQRASHHRAVIDAAIYCEVKLIGYTSVLHANTSPLGLADEHNQTEVMLKASAIPFVLLRNGWYTENYATSIPTALAHGALMGSAGDGRIASASRADYAAAAALTMTLPDQAGRVYELAGDTAYTLSEFAAEISRQSGKAVNYMNLPRADYKAALVGFGLPEPIADLLADSDSGASQGGLFDDKRQLSTLIGRPTTPMAETIAAELKA